MAAPTTYSEATLARFMEAVLGRDELASALAWTHADGDYIDAVDEALLVYGVDDIANITGRNNIRKLRAIARVEVWRLVMSRTAGDYDVKLDSDSYSRSQLHDHATKMFAREQQAAVRLGVGAYQQRTAGQGTVYVAYDRGYWSGRTS